MSFIVESIYYYPLKSGNSIALNDAYLMLCGIDGDRKWALVSPNQTALPNGEWMSCDTFERYKIRPNMASWQTEATETGINLSVDGQDFHLVEDEEALIGDRLVRLARADKGYWDDSEASISIINLNTIESISKAIGVELEPIRFRANIYVRAEPWSEFHWLGKQLKIGDANLTIMMPIARCRAISVDPNTGEITHNIPAQLAQFFGHTYCGVYATVTQAGQIEVDAIGSVANKLDIKVVQKKANRSDMSDIKEWPRSVQVVDIVEEAEGIRSLWLRDSLANTKLWDTYKSGQHIRLHGLQSETNTTDTWRSYTVSGRCNDLFRITVKLGTGSGSGRIHTLNINDDLIMTGPSGKLTVPQQVKSIYFLTAGIGITPAVAMLADLSEFEIDIHFIHTTKAEQLALWYEIESFAENKPNVSCTLFITNANSSALKTSNMIDSTKSIDVMGRFSSSTSSSTSPESASAPASAPVTSVQYGRPDMLRIAQSILNHDAHIVICGPTGFSADILTKLDNLNIHPERIGSETFLSASIDVELREPSSVGPHSVLFSQSGIEAIWGSTDGTLLDLAERHGLVPNSHCRAGICGACKVGLGAGQVEQLVDCALSDNTVLLCCSVPKSDIIVQL